MVAAVPPDAPEDFIKDLVYYYDGLCDQELWSEIFNGSYERLKDYEQLGYEFITDTTGRLKGIPQRGLEHVKCYLGKPFGMGGKNMVAALVKEAERLGVDRLGRIVVTDILKRDGWQLVRAGLMRSTVTLYFQCARVILARQWRWKVSYHHNIGKATHLLRVECRRRSHGCEFGVGMR
jgi:succinate dehydrogenase/fumarate reductase flavoprotein subunit